MGNVIKAYRYRIVDNSAFEMPLPMKFTVWKADAPVADYIISEDEQVSYTIITKFKELMITTIHRPLDISDIYYMFSCRVFQDRTPFTKPILERMGLEKYNVCNILRRTHGISPYDDYWIRFDGEKITFDQAVEEFDKYLIGPEVQPVPVVSYPSGAEIAPEPNTATDSKVDEILSQKKLRVADIVAESAKPVSIAPDTSYEPQHEIENNKMSDAEIEALLHSVGLDKDEEPVLENNSGKLPDVDPSSRSQMEPSGGTMSQEDIEKLLSANSAPAAESPEPAPVPAAEPESANSGGKMSQDDIEKLLAANSPEPAPEPAPAPESAPSGGKMSQEDIEKLLAANSPEPAPEPAPAPESAPSGGKMSQEDIEKLLAANSPEPAPEPAPAPESAPSGGKMSQEDIEKLLAANSPEPAPEPAPAPESAPSGGKMSQEDIEKLLAANSPEPAPEPAPATESAPSGGKMSQEDIEKLLAATNEPLEDELPKEPATAESAPSGGKMSQDDIEALLNSMHEEASK